ncbi:hypothetical protein [Actinokineospora globicatena]|uniref:hypothetical protein n=1 Tax=Actinokineospora globicatena TaxID=103729 RepID=UPI00255421C6|nr:hypothetical protein [Actinokineospora globicatena]
MAVDSRLIHWVRACLPGGPFRAESWRSPLRGRWLAVVFGLVLLAVVEQGVLSGRGFGRLGVIRGG